MKKKIPKAFIRARQIGMRIFVNPVNLGLIIKLHEKWKQKKPKEIKSLPNERDSVKVRKNYLKFIESLSSQQKLHFKNQIRDCLLIFKLGREWEETVGVWITSLNAFYHPFCLCHITIEIDASTNIKGKSYIRETPVIYINRFTTLRDIELLWPHISKEIKKLGPTVNLVDDKKLRGRLSVQMERFVDKLKQIRIEDPERKERGQINRLKTDEDFISELNVDIDAGELSDEEFYKLARQERRRINLLRQNRLRLHL